MNIKDLISGTVGNQLVGGLSQRLGLEQSQVTSVISMATPFILGQLKQNAKTEAGAQSLNNALNDHSGSILDNIGSLLGGEAGSEGLGILGHIFGDNQPKITEGISQKTGISTANVMQILIALAPVIMGFLGKQKQENNISSSGIESLLGNVLGKAGAGGNLSAIEKLLDQNGDGSVSDDLLNMGSKLFKGLF